MRRLAGPNVTFNMAEMSCGRTKMLPYHSNRDKLGPNSTRFLRRGEPWHNVNNNEHFDEVKLFCQGTLRFEEQVH